MIFEFVAEVFKIKISHGYTVRIQITIGHKKIYITIMIKISEIGAPTDSKKSHA